MTEKEEIDILARTICSASRNFESHCPFCEKGQCIETMWRTFIKEATSAHGRMKLLGYSKSHVQVKTVLHR